MGRARRSAADLTFEDVRLTLSFRSARAVLSAVDATFPVAEHFRGLSFEDDRDRHRASERAARRAGSRRVVARRAAAPRSRSRRPGPRPSTRPNSTRRRSSWPRRVAQAIKCWTTEGDEWGRVWRAGDVLVLVRKRGPAFEAVIRALKEAGVPVAGADRLDIGEHIAVRDLVAAGRAALLPDDDLTLATALKSPLVGLTDDDLIRIAAGRADHESLARRARTACATPATRRPGAAATLCNAWRALARRHGPFGFYATLLGPHERACAARGAAWQRGRRCHRRVPVPRAPGGDAPRRPRSPPS